MTPVEELRKRLDELGIEYQMHDGGNRVCFDIDYCEQCGDYLKSIDVIGGCVIASQSYLTPEQAIAATVGAQTVDKENWRIEFLTGLAREYLHRYGTLMAMMGDDVTDETLAVEGMIREVAGKFHPITPEIADEIAAKEVAE